MNYYDVYVPVEGKLQNIAPGSAIVGNPTETQLHDGRRLTQVYYEGNLFGAENMRLYEQMLLIAAGRLSCHYPTVAQRLVPSEELICVGTYCYETQTFDLEEPEIHAAWWARHYSQSGDETQQEAFLAYRWGVRS